MSDTTAILKNLAIECATSVMTSRIVYAKNNVVLYAVTGGLIFLTAAFAAISVFCYFAQVIQFATAGLYTSILVFVLASAFYIYGKMREKAIEREIHNEKIWIASAVDIAGDILEKEIADPVKDNPKMALLIAGIAGFALSKRYL